AGGFLSADGVPLDFAALLTEAPLVDEIDSARPEKLRFVAGEKAAIKRIRIYTTSGEFIYEFFNQDGSDFVSVAENELLTRDITDNAAVIPDECFVVVEVSKAGTYYPEFDRSESFGWNCVFRFRYAGGASSATAEPPTTTPESIPTPTVAPTATATPSSAPTKTPTATPTSAPTKTPTSTPTSAPTPTIDPDQILIKRIEPILPKGTIEVGESMMIDFMVTPDNFTYGTVRYKLAEDNGCAILRNNGTLTGLKPGVVRVIIYCEEYDVQLTPVNIVIKEHAPAEPEPEHEIPLDEQYRPDTLTVGSSWTEEQQKERVRFLVYNGHTPDELPTSVYRGKALRVSPYSGDFTFYVQLTDYACKREDNKIRISGVKVLFYEPSGKQVGYSYTNKNGIAMFTIKAQDQLDLRVAVENDEYTSDFVTNYGETVNCAFYPGGRECANRSNSGRAAEYAVTVVNSFDYKQFKLNIVDMATGAQITSGMLRFYTDRSGGTEFDRHDLDAFGTYMWRGDGFWDNAQENIKLEYVEGSNRFTAQCTFGGRDFVSNTVTLQADIANAAAEDLPATILIPNNHYIKLGRFEQDNDLTTAEDIEWLVVETQGNKALVVSRNILFPMAYSSNVTIDTITWKESAPRRWLNSLFLSHAFTAAERAVIQPTSGYGVTDSVFLLSVSEAEKLYPTFLKATVTPFAAACGINEPYGRDTYYWWLIGTGGIISSPCVDTEGNIVREGMPQSGEYGLRPAMWIEVTPEIIASCRPA
ncbi:MAG: hypothetical protein J6X19_04345, partial [Clostridia bacterium]|nr:hypothetical protein [Clostridia bacterium]